MYPDLPRKQRETAILQKYPAVFIIGIGWPLKDGYPHEMRAADYDDWVTIPAMRPERPHAWLERRHPGVEPRHQAPPRTNVDGHSRQRGDAEEAARADQPARLPEVPVSPGDLNNADSLSIGGGIGQSRTLMLLLRKAHLGEVSVTVWPKVLKEMCAKKEIFVLE